MFDSNKPTIYVSAHGKCSATGTKVDPQIWHNKYNIAFLARYGEKVTSSWHNKVIQEFSGAAGDTTKCEFVLRNIYSIPSTICVSHIYQLSFGQKEPIANPETNSHHSWECLEHKLTSLPDTTSSDATADTCVPSSVSCVLRVNKPVVTIPDWGIRVYFNKDLLTEYAISIVKEPTKAKHIDADTFTKSKYIVNADIKLPCFFFIKLFSNVGDHEISLSQLMDMIPKIHFCMIVYNRCLPQYQNKDQESGFYAACGEAYDELKAMHIPSHTPVAQQTNFANVDSIFFDLTIPEDTNMILGICREADASF